MSTAVQSVKVSFGEDLRRFALNSCSFSQLEDNIKAVYAFGTARILVKYQDDEGDWINVSSDRELEVALQLAQKNTLRICVTLEKPNISLTFENPNSAGEIVVQPTSSFAPSGQTFFVPSEQTSPPMRKDSKEWKGKYEKKYEKKVEKFQRKTEHLQKKALKNGAARFVSDTFPDGTSLAPNQEFLKTWTIRNESMESWPQSYQFTFKKGHNMSSIDYVNLPKTVEPGEEFQISIPMRAPNIEGKHSCVWKFIGANGKPFGQPFRVKIFVGENSKATFQVVDLEMKLALLASRGFDDKFFNEKILRICKGDVDKAIWKLTKKAQKKSLKGEKRSKH